MSFIKISGYWIDRHRKIPVGCDLATDLNLKLNLPLHVVFDVGANIGQTALKFHNEFRHATIHSFEPVEETFRKLQENTRKYSRVHCHKAALGNKEGTVEIRLHDPSKSVLNSLNDEVMKHASGRVEKILETTGDKFCETHHIDDIDLLKIDTEGYEIRVLEGFQNMLSARKIKALYCEVGFSAENRRNTFLSDLMSWLGSKGYKFYGLYEVKNKSIKTDRNYGNALFVSDSILTG
jgi:FkbM family methyltransferase